MEMWVVPALAACAVSLVLSTASFVWVIAFSTPASIRKFVDHGIAIAKEALHKAEEIEIRFLAHKADTTAIHESIEGVLESVERKRRQISGAASRLNTPPAEPVPMTRDEIVQAARGKVYGG